MREAVVAGREAPRDRAIESGAPLYERLLGSEWAQLAAPVRRLHSPGPRVYAHGRLSVTGATTAGARAIARALRLPRASPAAATTLAIVREGDGERWVRRFERRRLDTRQSANAGTLLERYGVLEFRFALERCDGGLRYRQMHVSVAAGSLRVPLPRVSAPVVDACERAAADDRVSVDVRISLPWAGLVLRYRGEMTIETQPS